MLHYYLLYFFVAVGAKLMLALMMIYMLLPADTRCSGCDDDTLLLRPRGPGRLGSRLTLGRIQRRWCPHCDTEYLARRVPARRPGRRRAHIHVQKPPRPQWNNRP